VTPAPEACSLSRANQEWVIDFATDWPPGGGLLISSDMEGFTRKCPAIEVDIGLSKSSRDAGIGLGDQPARKNGERAHSGLAYRTPEEFANTCSELTHRMGFKTPIPLQPRVSVEQPHKGTRDQRFRYCLATNGRPLTASCRSSGRVWRHGRLRQDGEGRVTVDGASQLGWIKKIEAGQYRITGISRSRSREEESTCFFKPIPKRAWNRGCSGSREVLR
jgi:hypothetical protein